MDHQQGERALLIKNHSGDWAVLKGKYVDSGTVGDANPGTFKAVSCNMSGKDGSEDRDLFFFPFCFATKIFWRNLFGVVASSYTTVK